MERSQGNSLYNYLKQTKISFFFFSKIREREDETGPVGGFRRVEEVEKGCRKVNIVKILCVHVCKWKMIPNGTTPGMREEGDKGE
jgi:hypothetical protein